MTGTKKRMPRAELEGHAVAYALLIMREWPVNEMNESLLEEYGVNALVRVKKRAWQHVRANSQDRLPKPEKETEPTVPPPPS